MLSPLIRRDALLKQTFESFRQEPYNRFVINVRRTRAEQIRQLLSEPSSIDLKIFLDEVWNFETQTIWRSHNQPIAVFKETRNGVFVGQLIEQRSLVSQPVTWEDLESALVSGDIELHGNYIWHQGSRQYDITKAKSDEQKLGQIQRVISILHDPQLSPVEKALSIQQVEGFGENNATGLVMIFDPKNFSLVNTVTRKALGILNEPIDTNKSLLSIQTLLQALKEELGAKDFFELDWFLYLIKEGKYLQGLPEEASSKTWLGYITRVLQTADEPLSATEVAHRAISLGLVTKGKTPAQTASRILTTHPELFEKVERGRYRLKDSREEAALHPSEQKKTTEVTENDKITNNVLDEYIEPPFEEILAKIISKGMILNERILRSYYLSLKVGRLIILAGPSGTGKTWLTEVYANAVGAAHRLVPVAPNWTTNEDLLGYADPLQQGVYHDTSFSSFLRLAANEYEQALEQGRTPLPCHLVLDEMNLARVEYYFAKFLSAMEVRARDEVAYIELGPGQTVSLYPNLSFIGTVNIDETTHGFADKVYDRAQVIELSMSREDLSQSLGDAVYRSLLMQVWDDIHDIAPFGFRIIKEIQVYISEAEELGVSWQEAMDDQMRQKILPKCSGADPKIGTALERLSGTVKAEILPLSSAKIQKMLTGFNIHGISSYF